MTSITNRTVQTSSVRRFIGAVSVCAAVLLSTSTAHARDLTGRLGLGYNAEFANYNQPNGTPGISLKYGISRDIDIEGVVGVNTQSPTNDVVGLKFFKNIFKEFLEGYK